jgi:hypothetical protein
MSLVTYQINQVVSKTNEVEFSFTGNIVLPKGDNAQRANELIGSLRYNTEKQVFEAKDANGWMPLGNFILNEDLDTGIRIENGVINIYENNEVTITISEGTITADLFVGKIDGGTY